MLRRRPSSAAIVGLALLALVTARVAWLYYFPPRGSQAQGPLLEGPCHVALVIDGQTLLVRQSGIEARVRMLGIDSPAPGAVEFLTEQAAGKEVVLKFDKRRIDRDRRFLAYVHTPEGLLNERLVEAGLARAKDYPGDSASIAKRLRGAEARAKSAQRGLWSGNL